MKLVTIFCTTKIEGWHTWPDAPEEHAYLRNSHRHMFGFDVSVQVSELDRQIEFIALKHEVEEHARTITSRHSDAPHPFSCETMADYVLEQVRMLYPEVKWISVTVDEDGENGAVVMWEADDD